MHQHSNTATMKSTTTLGQLLRYHRKQADFTQAKLAQKLGYTHSMLSHFERDKRQPPQEFLEAFVETLALSAGDAQAIWASLLQLRAGDGKPTVELQQIATLLDAARNGKKYVDHLEWPGWQQLFEKISRQQMAAGRHKYFPQLYLPRQAIEDALTDFLQSEQPSLVLVGRSGVGKSNFLLATADHLPQSHPQTAMLLYNGAALPADKPLAEVIAGDISGQMADEALTPTDVWGSLKQIATAGRSLVVAVDALNEHPQPARLLQRLEQFARRYANEGWLKVVWSCRPETWRLLQQQVGITELLYYKDPATGEPALTLSPFSNTELPAAYANYQQLFELQTTYPQLTPQVQAALSDPLQLLLVAGIYHQQALPATLSTATLVGEYMQALSRTGRLQAEDMAWLSETLLPLMLNDTRPVNKVLLTVLAPGANQKQSSSLTRLLNAEILTQEGVGPRQWIAFKYERFFDHLCRAAAATTGRGNATGGRGGI
jgi:transcriptional regulator with XRE-family HTH domain